MFDYQLFIGNPWRVLGAILLAAAPVLLLLALVHFLPPRLRRLVINVCTFLIGLVFVVEYFWPVGREGSAVLRPGFFPYRVEGDWLTQTTDRIGQIVQVVVGFTLLLGIYNLVHIHGNNIRRRRPGAINSWAFFIAFLLMAGSAFWRDWYEWFGDPQTQFPPEFILDPNMRAGVTPPLDFDPSFASDFYSYLFNGLYVHLEATMFSVLAFFIVSAAYRAFRIRSVEAGILMATAMLLMLGQVPLGMAITSTLPTEGFLSIFRLEIVSSWVLDVVNTPVQRAIDFGLGLGLLAMSLRIWLSLERGAYFGAEV